jgi:hypothetical protein
MKREQHAIFGGMHISLYIYVSEIDRALKSRHRIFRCIAGATAMSEGDRRIMFKKRMFH